MDQKQHEDPQSRRSKLSENQDSAHHHHRPQPPPQKCPRCDSLNTKFCYYNNYSLSQPRYFCKTCRRYWTQGGTLRNVPVGGGCRKGKRPRSTTSSPTGGESSSRSQALPPPPLLPLHLPTSPVLLPWARGISCINTGMIAPSGGGIFPSLPAMQSFTQQQGSNQAMDASGDANTSIFQGFNFPLMKSQLDQPLQLIQLDSGGFPEKEDEEKNLISSWNHREKMNNNPSTSNIDFWNSPSGSASDGMPSSSLEPNPWPNFPGFGNPP